MNKPRLSRQARATVRTLTAAQRKALAPWLPLIQPGVKGYADRAAILIAAESL